MTKNCFSQKKKFSPTKFPSKFPKARYSLITHSTKKSDLKVNFCPVKSQNLFYN